MLNNALLQKTNPRSGEKKRVLIIDDSLLIFKIIEKFLSTENYNILFAKNASEAVEILENITPDVILLDIILPDIDGFNLLKLLKLRNQTEDVPVIFISSLDKGVDISTGLSLGAHDYIIKPFTSNELKNKITRAINETNPFCLFG